MDIERGSLLITVKKTLAANTTYSGIIPIGYRLDSVIFEETAGNAAGNVQVGTTEWTADVVMAFALSGSELSSVLPILDIFSLSASQSLSVSSSAWGTSSVDVYFLMRRVKE